MLPSSGYFKGVNCPFFVHGLCERPHCQFRHIRPDEPVAVSLPTKVLPPVMVAPVVTPSYSSAAAAPACRTDLFQMVKDAIADLEEEVNEGEAMLKMSVSAEVLPLPDPVALQNIGSHDSASAARNGSRAKTKVASSAAAAPVYRPTPIAQLKKLNSTTSTSSRSSKNDSNKLAYDPTDSIPGKSSTCQKSSGYKPTPKIPYVPAAASHQLSSVTYNPQIVANVQASYSGATSTSRYGIAGSDDAGSPGQDYACFSDDDEADRITPAAVPTLATKDTETSKGEEEPARPNSFDLVNQIMKQSRQCEELIKSSSVIRDPAVLGGRRGESGAKMATKTADTRKEVSRSAEAKRRTSAETISVKKHSDRTAKIGGSAKPEVTSKLKVSFKPEVAATDSLSIKNCASKRDIDPSSKNSSRKAAGVPSSPGSGTSNLEGEKASPKTKEPSKKHVSSVKSGSSKTERRNGELSSSSSTIIGSQNGELGSKREPSSSSGSRDSAKKNDSTKTVSKTGDQAKKPNKSLSSSSKVSSSKKRDSSGSSKSASSSGQRSNSKSSSSSGKSHHRKSESESSPVRRRDSGSGSDRSSDKTSSKSTHQNDYHHHRSKRHKGEDVRSKTSVVPSADGCDGQAAVPQVMSPPPVQVSFPTAVVAVGQTPVYDYSLTDSEEEDDTYAECLKIFNEYQSAPKPEPQETRHQKKATALAQEDPSELLVGKKRIAHQTDQSLVTYTAKRRSTLNHLCPSQVMNNRLLEMKKRMEENALKELEAVPQAAPLARLNHPVPSSSSGSFTGTISGTGFSKQRVAHTAAVTAAAIARMAQPSNKLGVPTARVPPMNAGGTPATSQATAPATTAHCAAKGASRVAHTPSPTALKRPLISVEFGSRIPMTIRQRYLNLIIDECLQIYDTEPDSFSRGLAEEKAVYDRSTNRSVYINLVVNIIKRLRDEKMGVSTPGQGLDRMVTPSSAPAGKVNAARAPAAMLTAPIKVSHEYNLGGKKAANVSYSIERPKVKAVDAPLTGARLYNALTPYRLTPEQLEENGFPLPHSYESGRAVIHKHDSKNIKCSDPNEKICTRCGHVFKISPKGVYLSDDECYFHWGRAFKKRGAGGLETRYSCCQQGVHSEGCNLANHHVVDCMDPDNLRGFIRTLPKTPPIDGNYGVFALDCEMCYTNMGIELTRVTVIGPDMTPVFETFVKPENEVVDYNTRFSGIKAEDLENVHTNLRDVQAILLSKFNDQTILIGHSLESDFKALKLIHKTVVDTSVVFPHKMGPPFKKALRTLMVEYLKKIIQNDVEGHDSQEDAAGCMELMMWKLKNDLKLNF